MSDDVVREIPLDQLHDSPFQPRTSYDGIEDLAANIKGEGRIHSPLLVRPRTLSPAAAYPFPKPGFEIVYGHRRRRGAELAGLATAPCIVRAMNDAEVRSAQMTENIQREAMKALDEAAGFRAQIDQDGISASELATLIGKSNSYVCGRLRLLDLCPSVRQALQAGEIEAEVALYIARVGKTKMQEKALGYIKGKYIDMGDSGKKSVRQIRELLNEHFTLRLDKALFDPDDEMLVPEAGYCGRCPKRTGNAPEFADVVGVRTDEEIEADAEAAGEFTLQHRLEQMRRVKHNGADVCTDPDCFDAKKKAHLKRQAVALEATGKVVVDGNRARVAIDARGNVKGAYIAVSEVKAELKAVATANKPAPITIQDPRTGKTVQAYKRDDLQAAGVKLAPKQPAGGDYEAQRRRREEEHQRGLAKAKAETAVRLQILTAVRQAAAAAERSAFDLQAIAIAMYDMVPWQDRDTMTSLHGVKSVEGVGKLVRGMGPNECALFMLDCLYVQKVNVDAYSVKDPAPALYAAAKHYGVDMDAIRTGAPGSTTEGASTPSPAAQAKKGAAAAGAAKKPKRKPLLTGGDPDAPDDAGLVDEQKDEAGKAGQAGEQRANLDLFAAEGA